MMLNNTTNNNSNLTARLIISHGLVNGYSIVLVFWKNTQFACQILFCPEVSAGHFEKLFHTGYRIWLHCTNWCTSPSLWLQLQHNVANLTPASSTGINCLWKMNPEKMHITDEHVQPLTWLLFNLKWLNPKTLTINPGSRKGHIASYIKLVPVQEFIIAKAWSMVYFIMLLCWVLNP